MTVLEEPASAIAAGLCLTARSVAGGRTARHPRPCGWCEYDLDALRRLIDGFEAWADRDPKDGTPRRFEVVVFQSQPARLQDKQVLEAQAFPPEQPVAAVEPPSAHDDDDDGGPVWMRG